MAAPILVLMFLDAQRPKAAEPPVLLIKATKTPKTTKKINIPAVPETESIKP